MEKQNSETYRQNQFLVIFSMRTSISTHDLQITNWNSRVNGARDVKIWWKPRFLTNLIPKLINGGAAPVEVVCQKKSKKLKRVSTFYLTRHPVQRKEKKKKTEPKKENMLDNYCLLKKNLSICPKKKVPDGSRIKENMQSVQSWWLETRA